MVRREMVTFSNREVREALAEAARRAGFQVDDLDGYAQVHVQRGGETIKEGLALVVTRREDDRPQPFPVRDPS